MAIFANVVGTVAHQLCQGDGHMSAHEARRFFANLACSRIMERKSTSSVSSLASRLSFAEGLPVRSCLSSRSWSRECNEGGNRNLRQLAGNGTSTVTV